MKIFDETKFKVGKRIRINHDHLFTPTYEDGTIAMVKTDGPEYGGDKFCSVRFDNGTRGCYDLRDSRLELLGGSHDKTDDGIEAAERDKWLTKGADLCLEALKELKSPGCKWLYLSH